MPKKLKDELQAKRGRNSLNAEIVQRLARSVEPDPALQIAELLRPLLAKLDDDARSKMVGLIASAVEILADDARGKRKK